MQEIQKLRNILLDYYMNNPDLGEEIDYLPDCKRIEIYQKELEKLTIKELKELFEDIN